MELPGPVDLPLPGDESLLAASEFQEAAAEELLEAANDILEKLGGVDWYDLRILECTLERDAAGRPAHATLKVQCRGRRKVVRRVPLSTAGLAETLERTGRLKIKPAEEPTFRAAVRAARLVLGVRDAVLRHPELAEPRSLLQLLNTCRRAMGRSDKAARARRQMLVRLGRAPGVGGTRKARAAYGPLMPGTRGVWAGLPPDARLSREVQRCLVKARDKIRVEAEKNGLLIPPGQELVPPDLLPGDWLAGADPQPGPQVPALAAPPDAGAPPPLPEDGSAGWDDDDL
ncbi:MAG: hypothetical protein L6E13_03580 [Firmicutes bacterium]|nr:hypothetical protein [Bacillota bacterium]